MSDGRESMWLVNRGEAKIPNWVSGIRVADDGCVSDFKMDHNSNMESIQVRNIQVKVTVD